MKHGARFTSSILIASSMMLCLVTPLYAATRSISSTHAARDTGSVVSSPSSGPVGAIIAVSGSGWAVPDGVSVSFGYMIASNCSIVWDSQTGTTSGGSFSGWFRWPQGTSLNTFTVCATIGDTTATASIYTVLSASAPQVSISPTTLTVGQQATITGSNYLPAGTMVQLLWEAANGSAVSGISVSPATSDSNGFISKTFTVPATTLSGGSYMIVASAGGGQPPTLSSSAPFTFNALARNPSPTPSPGPTLTPTPNPSPTAMSTATAKTTPTVGSTTPVATQNSSIGQTPTAITTPSTTSNTGVTTSTNLPGGKVLVVGIIGSPVLLIALLAIALQVRRRRASSREIKNQATPAVGPAMNGVSTWQNWPGVGSPFGNGMPSPVNNGPMTSTPSWASPTANGAPMMPAQSWPTPAANGGSVNAAPVGQANNGMPPAGNQPARPLPYTPYTQLLQQSVGGNPGPVAGNSAPVYNDPMLEAIKRQVQMGLFVTPGQQRDEGPPS